LEGIGLVGRIILKRVFSREDGAVNWIDMVEDTDKLWALLNTKMKLGVEQNKFGEVFD